MTGNSSLAKLWRNSKGREYESQIHAWPHCIAVDRRSRFRCRRRRRAEHEERRRTYAPVTVPAYGDNPRGQLILTPDGRYSIVLARATMPKIAAGVRTKGTAEENKAVVEGSIAHVGRYTIDGGGKAITFHIEMSTFPNWDGTTQKRARLDGFGRHGNLHGVDAIRRRTGQRGHMEADQVRRATATLRSALSGMPPGESDCPLSAR